MLLSLSNVPRVLPYNKMKVYLQILFGFVLLLGLGCASTQTLSAEPSVPVVSVPSVAGPMDQLLAPVALYPDALVAIILPAATASSDIVLAARFLNAGKSPDQIESQPWDDSVKALAHYPDVIKWMDENLAWTQQLGAAYLDQPQEVMSAIQRNRLRARANGILVDTPQQQVVIEDGYVRIIPAQADVIYVPRYDPEIVYVERPDYYSPDPWLTFGIGFGVGYWLSYDCDWRSRAIWVDHDRSHWRQHRDWRYPEHHNRPGYVSRPPGWQQWHPTPGRPRPYPRHFDSTHWQNQPRPSLIAGAPSPFQHRRPDRIAPNSQSNIRPERSDRYRTRSEQTLGSRTVIAPAQTMVSSPAQRQEHRRPEPTRASNNGIRRRNPSDQARGDLRSTPPTVRAVQKLVPAVSNPALSHPVVSSPVPQRSRPGVPNPQTRRIRPNTGERFSDVRHATPHPAISNPSQRYEHPAPAVSNPVPRHVAPAPIAARVPQVSRQPQMRAPAPAMSRVERNVAPAPRVQQQVVRSAPAPQAAQQDNGNSSSGHQARAERGGNRRDQN